MGSEEQKSYWAVVPAADGSPYEIVEGSEVTKGHVWRPMLEHECTMGGPFKNHNEAKAAAEVHLNATDKEIAEAKIFEVRRLFQERIFFGSEQYLATRVDLLHTQLENALVLLSAIQQPPMSTDTTEKYATYHKGIVAAEEQIWLLFQDIAVALIGEEVVLKKQYTDLQKDLKEFVRINQPTYPAPGLGKEGEGSYATRVSLMDELQEIFEGEWSDEK